MISFFKDYISKEGIFHILEDIFQCLIEIIYNLGEFEHVI